jgi:hypothetical protein
VIATGEQRVYANLLLAIGVVPHPRIKCRNWRRASWL